MKKTILGVPAPPKPDVQDKNDPFYGNLSVKNETLTGVVVKRDISRSATIEWERARFVKKYERYEDRKSRLRVHNPASVDAQVGQRVLVAKTRPISKTKHHVILKVIEDKQ